MKLNELFVKPATDQIKVVKDYLASGRLSKLYAEKKKKEGNSPITEAEKEMFRGTLLG